MSINQSAKYKKFIVGAASAALVASAVAPVASAKDFKDTKGNTHEPAIDALSDAGVITGYPDGSFLPNKTMTRSDVVKLMGKWLVSEGYKVPTDYKTKMRFDDLKTTSNDELLQYAAVVKDNGVFNGSNGNLLAGDNITRENMAVVIVRAFDQVKDMDLVTFVKAQEFKKDVTDLAKAKAEARTAIDVLDFFDITNPAAPAFNPKNTTTRGQFATFLHKTVNTDFSAVKAPEVDENQVAVDAAAEQVKAGAVTVARGNYATDANKLAAVQTYVTSLVTEKDVVATVVAGKTAGEFAVTLTKGEAKAEKTIAMTFDFAADDRFVTEVNALNATQVEVKFSAAVDKASLFTDGKSGAFKATVSLGSLDTQPSGTLAGELSADGKTLKITTQNVISKRYDVVVDGLKAVTGSTFDKYESTITIAADKTAPTILGTERVSASQVKVTFSEPLKSLGTVSYKLADGSTVVAGETGITASTFNAGDTEVLFTIGSGVAANKEVIATFIGAQDQAGNLMTPNPATASLTKGAADGVVPTVSTITQTSAKEFAVKFSEQLSAAPTVTVGGVAVSSVVKDNTDPTKYIVTTTGVLDGAKTVGISSFSDLSGEVGATTSKVVTFVKDADAPKVVSSSVVQDATNGKEYLELSFDKNVNLDGIVADSKVSGVGTFVKDYVTSASTNFTATQVAYKDSSNKKVVRVELDAFLGDTATDIKGATYTLDLTFVKLTSDANTTAATTAVTFTRGVDGTPVSNPVVAVSTLAQDAADNNKVNVTFDKAVDGASATNPANYKIDGAVVESVTLKPVTTGTTTTQVAVLNLKAGSNNFTGTRNITIENVKALGSTKIMEPYFINTVSLKENIAPTVASAKLTATNKITLTFSENVSDVAGLDFEVLVGGKSQGTANEVNAGILATSPKTVEISITELDAAALAKGISLKALSTLDITDVAGNKLSVPANILVTQ
ncbi:S-layer homology domain-containing protein [Sporosarcina sp. E16_8]|uniref:S-layer homology domain-containing protein n=1 Tax=Sporosarcina sp. E16_8 TaxID=2789295 RepID=UPI001A915AD8|nr:S-layer homology domain-containing protein [Sporosarcina sp. E16_8]MBO0588579.1 S-layer homology domain-containing protein [Sporosarcina sp. E16_8]